MLLKVWILGALVLWAASPGGPAHAGQPPDTPVGHRLRWALDAAEVGAKIEPTGVCSPAFLDRIPAEAVIDAITETSAESGGFELLGVQPRGEWGLTAAVRARSDRACWRIELDVDAEPPHGITRLSYRPDPALGVQYGDGWPELRRLLRALPGRVTFAAYEDRSGSLRPIHRLNARKVMAIGSTFKLWVLGALAERIANGDATWETTLAIRDEWKSLPSGTMHELPAGETRSLEQFAMKMISISDNTATDHLMHFLGVDDVRRFAVRHGSPKGRNEPFITTREFFKLKAAAEPELRDRFVAAGAKERDRLLKGVVSRLFLPQDSSQPDHPLAIDDIEYFASASAVARLLVALASLAKQEGLAPVWNVMADNRGIEWDRSKWPSVAYKGGSEPGVLYTAWLMEREDGRRFVLCFGVNDTESTVDVNHSIRLLKAAGEILARVP